MGKIMRGALFYPLRRVAGNGGRQEAARFVADAVADAEGAQHFQRHRGEPGQKGYLSSNQHAPAAFRLSSVTFSRIRAENPESMRIIAARRSGKPVDYKTSGSPRRAGTNAREATFRVRPANWQLLPIFYMRRAPS